MTDAWKQLTKIEIEYLMFAVIVGWVNQTANVNINNKKYGTWYAHQT